MSTLYMLGIIPGSGTITLLPHLIIPLHREMWGSETHTTAQQRDSAQRSALHGIQ